MDKYNGLIRFDEENGYFICDILIPEQFCRKLVKNAFNAAILHFVPDAVLKYNTKTDIM